AAAAAAVGAVACRACGSLGVRRMRVTEPIEPRFFPRADLAVEVRVTCGAEDWTATLVNVSEGGALVRGTRPLAAGTLAALAFELPGLVRTLTLAATVIRTHTGAQEASVGFRFEDVSEADMVVIRAFVERKDPTAWEAGLALPRELAVRFVPVIRRQAYRIARRLPAHIQVDDLVGAGFLALVEAYARFDPELGSHFEPYALIRIRGGMLDELRGNDPVSRGMRRLKREVDGAAQRLQGDLGRPPDDEEIAGHVGLSVEDYRACLEAVSRGRHTSLQDVSDQGESMRPPSGLTRAVRSDLPDPEREAGNAESARSVAVALAALPPRLRQVLEMYYGQELTLRDIGTLLGVSEGRISQLVSQAVEKMRARMLRGGETGE
ncbi:MAG: FliA/WhiG family RNA polymerase sigma factor, partial [Deltaproteobacteria bacterium]